MNPKNNFRKLLIKIFFILSKLNKHRIKNDKNIGIITSCLDKIAKLKKRPIKK